MKGYALSEEETQYIRISTSSKEDVAYVKELMKRGEVEKEDLRPNMSFIIPYHGPETEDTQ